jgi:hypothetical protein
MERNYGRTTEPMEQNNMKFTEEHKRKISLALRGKPHIWGRKTKIKRMCPCGNMILFTPGQIRKGHGKYCSRICYYKYRINFDVSKLSHKLKGIFHWAYKGDNAGYKALHLRVGEQRGKAKKCLFCGSDKFVEWASVTRDYKNVFDYISLCRKCHRKFDDVGKKSAQTRRGGGVTA